MSLVERLSKKFSYEFTFSLQYKLYNEDVMAGCCKCALDISFMFVISFMLTAVQKL